MRLIKEIIMKAILITPETQSISVIDVADHNDIAKLIGFETIISDEVGSNGDRLFFDEECFLRGLEGRFKVDTLVPISGKGVIVGSDDEGVTLKDLADDVESLRSRIKYL